MKFRTILIVGALLVVATGVVRLALEPHRGTASDVRQAHSTSVSTMDAARPSGPPPMPASFYGTVTVDGANVPQGWHVSAWIDGIKYAETSATIFDGKSVYAINVPGDDPATPEVEGGRPGDTVVFYVGELPVKQTATWQGATNTELNLTAVGDVECVFLPLVSRRGSQGN